MLDETSVGIDEMPRPTKRPASEGADRLARLDEMLAQEGGLSPFAGYVREHFEELAKIIGRRGVRWDAIAKWAEQEGLHGSRGPITASAAKRTFDRERTRREKGKPVGRAGRPPKTKPAGAQVSPVRVLGQGAGPKADPVATPPEFGEEFLEKMRRGQGWMQPAKRGQGER